MYVIPHEQDIPVLQVHWCPVFRKCQRWIIEDSFPIADTVLKGGPME